MPPQFNFQESYKKPEDNLPADIAKEKAHPEMIGFDKEAMRKKLREQGVFEFDEDTDLGIMERMAREDEINLEIQRAEQEHKYFVADFERGIQKYYEEVALRPEKAFKEQFVDAVKKASSEVDLANRWFRRCWEGGVVAVSPQVNGVPSNLISYENGKLYKVALTRNYGKIDLNPFGFPGLVDFKTGTIVLNNNAGKLPASSSDTGYEYGSLKDSITSRESWNKIEVVGMTRDEISPDEARIILSAHTGLFKELFEKIKYINGTGTGYGAGVSSEDDKQ